MQILMAGLAANTGHTWIYLAIAILGCVLAAEVFCIALIAMRMHAAATIKKHKQQKDEETGLSGLALLALSGGITWSSEVWLIVFGALTLAGAAAIGILLLICRLKGYLFVSPGEAKQDLEEATEKKTEPKSRQASSDEDRLFAIFSESQKPFTEPENEVTDEPAEEPAKERVEEPEPVVAEQEVLPQTEQTVVTQTVETVVTETVRETVTERQVETVSSPITQEEPDTSDEGSEEEDEDRDDAVTDSDEDDAVEESELDDPDHFTGNERVIGFDEATGCQIVARYRKSFEAKLIQSQSHIKKYYSEIKNALLAYKGTKSRMSWTADTFHNGRDRLVIVNVKTRILELYLALDPATLDGSVYRGQDVGALRKYEETPFRYKIRTPRKFNWALELIARVCEEHGLTPIENEHVDYDKLYPFDTIDHLVERKLIKVTTRLEKPATSFEFDNEAEPVSYEEEPMREETVGEEQTRIDTEERIPEEGEQLTAEIETPSSDAFTERTTETVRETTRVVRTQYTQSGSEAEEVQETISFEPVDRNDPLTAAFGEAHPENLWSEENNEEEAERMNEGTDETDVSEFEERTEPEEPQEEEYVEEETISTNEEGDEGALSEIFSNGEDIPTDPYLREKPEESPSGQDDIWGGSTPVYNDPLYDEISVDDLPPPKPKAQLYEPQYDTEPQKVQNTPESIRNLDPWGDEDNRTYRPYSRENTEPDNHYREQQQPYRQTYDGQNIREPESSQYNSEPQQPRREETTAPYIPNSGDTVREPEVPREEPKQTPPESELAVIDVRVLDEQFLDEDYINLAVLKRRGLVSQSATRLKIRARGVESMKHALIIAANQFTYDAIRVISTAGGEPQIIR